MENNERKVDTTKNHIFFNLNDHYKGIKRKKTLDRAQKINENLRVDLA